MDDFIDTFSTSQRFENLLQVKKKPHFILI